MLCALRANIDSSLVTEPVGPRSLICPAPYWQFSFSLEAFRSSLIQDFCAMLSLFFRPHFNRGFGPVRGDPNDMPS
jgi:hypothetical protein